MKRFLLPQVLGLLMCFGSSAAFAQNFNAFVGGGTAVGMGQLNVDTSHGWTVLGGLDLFAGLPEGISLGMAGSYTRIPYQTGGFGEAEHVTSVTGGLGYHIALRSTRVFSPYLKAAGGYQLRRYDPGSSGYLAKATARPELTAGFGVLIETGLLARGFVEAHVSARSDAGFAALVAGVNLPL